jgi:uncharacterized protein (DUF1810 family)
MSDSDDPHILQRFVVAQEEVYAAALAELRRGRKEGHWMWFIFPQIDGLGRSETAKFFALKSRAEALAYLQHKMLGARLTACAEALLSVEGRSAHEILGSPDDLKLHSSMTLFAALAGRGFVYQAVLQRYFAGRPDARTLEIMAGRR